MTHPAFLTPEMILHKKLIDLGYLIETNVKGSTVRLKGALLFQTTVHTKTSKVDIDHLDKLALAWAMQDSLTRFEGKTDASN